MNSQKPKPKNRTYDPEERTAKFGEKIISFCKDLPRNEITKPPITQLVKSSTSIGANFCEADDAESGKDFAHKIGICKKESRETKHFLRMMASAIVVKTPEARILWQEAKELNLIFNAIYRKVKNKNSSKYNIN